MKRSKHIQALYLVTLISTLFSCSGVSFIKQDDLYTSKEDLIEEDPISTRTSGYSREALRAGFNLVWQDEFDGSEIDGFNWQHLIDGNGGGNNELQYYTKSKANSFVKNGLLHIKAIERSTPLHGCNYTSARLHSRGQANWTYGRFDVRAKLPVQQGIWPAIWMLPKEETYGKWPQSGEIDIVETIGHEPKNVYGTIHYGPKWPENLHTGDTTQTARGNVSQAFHLYSVEWDTEGIRWYLDDKLFASKTKKDIAPHKWPFDQPFYLILNLAIGGNWPGNPDKETVFPKYMFVDYVRVYQKNEKKS